MRSLLTQTSHHPSESSTARGLLLAVLMACCYNNHPLRAMEASPSSQAELTCEHLALPADLLIDIILPEVQNRREQLLFARVLSGDTAIRARYLKKLQPLIESAQTASDWLGKELLKLLTSSDIPEKKLEHLQELIEAGADLSNYGNFGFGIFRLIPVGWLSHAHYLHDADFSPLLFAIYNAHPKAVALLLETGAACRTSQLAQAQSRKTKDIALMIAIRNRNETIYLETEEMHSRRDAVIKILAAHENVNAQNNDGQTALMLVTKYGLANAIQTLLDHKADPFIKDKEERTAFNYADNLSWYQWWRIRGLLAEAQQKYPSQSEQAQSFCTLL